MNYYAEVGSNLQMVDDAGSGCPEGWIEMTYARPEDENTLDYTAQADGTWTITKETLDFKLTVIESQWREDQMVRIANQLLMIEDEDPDAEPGTKRQWMDYRIALRKWVTNGNPNFPDSTKRPVAPT